MRPARVFLVVAWLVGCGSEDSPSVSSDGGAGDAPAERRADATGGAGEVGQGDCEGAEPIVCVASCASATPTPLICDDEHWECETGIDSRLCGQ